MDEILFHLSNQMESLQVQTMVGAQHGYAWVATCLTQLGEYFQTLANEQYVKQLKSLGQQMVTLVNKGFDQVQNQYHSLSLRNVYQQFENLPYNDVTRRDMVFCLTGLTIGTLMGCYIGMNWKNTSNHLYHMKAIICHHYIGIEGVSMLDDAEIPVICRSNEVLIQVKAASVNTVDIKICSGYSKVYRRLLNSGIHKELPVTLGRDCAGIVVDIGRNVVDFDIGDEVFLAVPSWAPGTITEFLVVLESQVVKRPKLISFEASTVLPYSGCLAWDALVNKSNIKEGNAEGKRVLVYASCTPVGCILTQLIKLWGGHVTSACKLHAAPVAKALGADEVILLDELDIEKKLDLYDKYHAIFYTGGQPINEQILKKYLLPHGSYVSTMPENLTSDSLGFVFGSVFAGCVRIKLLIQFILGFNAYQWTEGAKLNRNYLQALSDLSDAGQLQAVVGKVYAPYNIDQALHHVLDPDSIGSAIITFK